jgi:Xaa-Pro aminopeptidase
MPAVAEVNAPFDWRKLDRIMEERDIDVLVVTSKHNVQYLLGGYRFFFFDTADAIGLSRYLPVLVYPRGRPDRATYIGNVMESYEQELGRFWTPNVLPRTWGSAGSFTRRGAWGSRRASFRPMRSRFYRRGLKTRRSSMRLFRSSGCAR